MTVKYVVPDIIQLNFVNELDIITRKHVETVRILKSRSVFLAHMQMFGTEVLLRATPTWAAWEEVMESTEYLDKLIRLRGGTR